MEAFTQLSFDPPPLRIGVTETNPRIPAHPAGALLVLVVMGLGGTPHWKLNHIGDGGFYLYTMYAVGNSWNNEIVPTTGPGRVLVWPPGTQLGDIKALKTIPETPPEWGEYGP